MHVLQVSWLHNSGREMMMIASGAVAFGRQRLKQEELLSRTVRSTIAPLYVDTLSGGRGGHSDSTSRATEPQACAAVGQAGLMSLYESMFGQYGVSCAQVRSCRILHPIYNSNDYGAGLILFIN